MPRAGRRLEELVRELERLLLDKPVSLRSPDFVVGRHSGSRRELDVALREIETDRILVMIECRDRYPAQDVRWIDELVGKRDDVGVARVIAVSPSGFSSGTRSYARTRGIELRTFQEIDAETVEGWISLRRVIVRKRNVQVSGVRVIVRDASSLSPDDRGLLLRIPIALDTPLFVRNDGVRASVNDLWKEAAKFGPFDQLAPGEIRPGQLNLSYPEPERSYLLEAEGRRFNIEQIQITGRFSYIDHAVPIERSYTYENDKGILTQNSEVGIEHEGVSFTFGVHRSADGSRMSITQRRAPDDASKVIHYDLEAVFSVSEPPNPNTGP